MFLSRNAIFTPLNSEQKYEVRMLFELLYNAKDFQTFYKTAAWARLRMNSGMFTTAFSIAVLYRPDTKYMKFPAIYEIYPNYFFDSSVIEEAQNLKMSRGEVMILIIFILNISFIFYFFFIIPLRLKRENIQNKNLKMSLVYCKLIIIYNG